MRKNKNICIEVSQETIFCFHIICSEFVHIFDSVSTKPEVIVFLLNKTAIFSHISSIDSITYLAVEGTGAFKLPATMKSVS